MQTFVNLVGNQKEMNIVNCAFPISVTQSIYEIQFKSL